MSYPRSVVKRLPLPAPARTPPPLFVARNRRPRTSPVPRVESDLWVEDTMDMTGRVEIELEAIDREEWAELARRPPTVTEARGPVWPLAVAVAAAFAFAVAVASAYHSAYAALL